MQGQTKGFTVIELIIFLAISGLLLTAMFLGTSTMAAHQRFSDATDNLQAFFQAQYEEVLNGVNVRTTDNSCNLGVTMPGKSQCLLLGKLLTLNAGSSTIQTSYIISTQQLDGTESGVREKLMSAGLQVTTNGQSTYELKWGATISEMTRSASALPRTTVDAIAFVRVPDSNQIQQLYYDSSGTLTNGLNVAVSDPSTSAYNPPTNATGPGLIACVKNTSDFGALSPRSAIKFSQGRGAGSITTDYQPGGLCTL